MNITSINVTIVFLTSGILATAAIANSLDQAELGNCTTLQYNWGVDANVYPAASSCGETCTANWAYPFIACMGAPFPANIGCSVIIGQQMEKCRKACERKKKLAQNSL